MNTIQAGEIQCRFVDRGQGRPVVLLHGFPLDHSMWNAQIEALSQHWRVIAPDLRGFGGSQVVPGVTSMEQMADDVHALLDALEIDEPIVLCGLSMGGYVAFQFWRKHRARLRGLILCDTRAVADSPEAAQGRAKMIDHVLRAGTSYVAEAMLSKLFAPSTFSEHPEIVEFERGKILSGDPQGIVAALGGLATRPDVRDYLPQIAVPTLVIVGELDAISTEPEMRTIAEAIPGSEYVVMPRSGHMTPLESPAEFNRAVEQFLRRVDSA